MKKSMNRTAILAFYTARKRKGDVARLTKMTDLSASHISNVVAGRRTINTDLSEAMYSISRRRVKATA